MLQRCNMTAKLSSDSLVEALDNLRENALFTQAMTKGNASVQACLDNAIEFIDKAVACNDAAIEANKQEADRAKAAIKNPVFFQNFSSINDIATNYEGDGITSDNIFQYLKY